MPNQTLRIEKRINADRELVFRAWLEPEFFQSWFLPPDTMLGTVEMEPRVGGNFRIDMHYKGKILPHHGQFRVIDSPEKLVFTWRSPATDDRETLVSITFDSISDQPGSPQAGSTLITLIHEQLEDAQLEPHSWGWTGILEGLRQKFE